MITTRPTLRELRESVGSDDFSTLLGATMNKRLQKAYAFTSSPWERYCDVLEVDDFKNQTIIELTELADIEKVTELAGYKEWSFAESSQTYRVYKYGKRLTVPWEWIRNDDLNAINKVVNSMGRAVRRTIDKFAVALLEAAAASSTVTTALSEATLTAAITEFESRTDATTGEKLGLKAKYLVVPTALQFTAARILQSTITVAAGATNLLQGDFNPLKGYLEPLVDPFLTSAVDWYLLADPADMPAIEMAFLKGYRNGPYFGKKKTDSQEELDFDTDGYVYKMRDVWGGKLVEANAVLKVDVT